MAPAAIDGVGQLLGGVMQFTSNIPNHPNAWGNNGPGGMALDATNHRLFMADPFNNRVLVFTLSNANDFVGVDRLPDFVLGQPSLSTWTTGTSATSVNRPSALVLASGNRLFVADDSNSRVLVFDVSTVTNGQSAIAVLGQPDFVSVGAGTTASRIQGSGGLAFDGAGNRLFVSDGGNNRVLVFDVATITNGEAAVNVLGQTDFTTATNGTSQSRMSSPGALAWHAATSRLFVADENNHRVLSFDLATIADGENAANVLGQSTFTSSSSGTTSASLNKPAGLAHDGATNRLFVVDSTNSRVLVFDVATIADGEAAVNVLGQPGFTSGTSATSASGLSSPGNALLAGGRLFVADVSNHRAVVFDVASITDGENAVDGVGHLTAGTMDFTRGLANDPPSSETHFLPMPVALDAAGHRLFVAEKANKRVLVYQLSANNDFTGVDRSADFVLGQPDFISGNAATTAASLREPTALAYDTAGQRLFVADAQNKRILVWNVATITNGMNAVNVLGQPDFISLNGAITSTGLVLGNTFGGLAFDAAGQRLFVADLLANRVLVYDVATITNGEAAVNVLGQSSFTSGGSGLSASSFNQPSGLAYDAAGNRLFVSDLFNRRVLVFDVAVVVDGENAVGVLGQANFVSNGLSAPTASTIALPAGLAFDPARQRLYAVDAQNNRVMLFSSQVTGSSATGVLGQSDLTSNQRGVSAAGLWLPLAVACDPVNNRVFVTDHNNNRCLLFNGAP